jgi:glyoxylase-like metal-dependent hydrolase (beta-lactamase superfamily II)
MPPTQPLCIDLDQPGLTGFRSFISAWLYRDTHTSLVVDPGPASTIPHLVDTLQQSGVNRLDYILLTHIHIDHAGGAGALLAAYPEAQVICHPDGIAHLVAPEKLWQGSLKVLGKTAEAYGAIVPVPKEHIGFSDVLGDSGIRAFRTPGHAPHHCCYLIDDLLFAGEVAGVRSNVSRGIYMRPATPPRFLLEVALDSIDRMLNLQPKRMVFAHHGLVDDAIRHLQIGRWQLQLWVQGVATIIDLADAERENAFFDWLLGHDPVFQRIDQLPADLLERERIFLGNTLRGMLEYVRSLPTESRVKLLEMSLTIPAGVFE